MDFALDDDQQLIVDTVRRFADRDLRAWSADADRNGAPPDRLTHSAGELGFFVDAVPAEHDGMLEGAFSHATRALRGFELGRGCAALAALLETNVEPALAVARWGSDAAKKELFASLASGGLALAGTGSLVWLLLGHGLMLSGGLITGAWLLSAHGQPMARFLPALLVGIVWRMALVLGGAAPLVLSGVPAFLSYLAGFAAAYVPMQLHEVRALRARGALA